MNLSLYFCIARTALFTLGLAAVSPVLAELPQYTVTRLDAWWGALEPSGFGTRAMGLNNSNEVLAQDTRGGTLASYQFQVWKDGQRIDAGPAVYPENYGYTGTIHYRNFDDSGRLALDINNLQTQDYPLGLAIMDVRKGTTERLPDIPGTFMDGSYPVLSSDGSRMIARSDDSTRGWVFEPGTLTWTEMSGPGWYVQPDAVNNSGAAAGRMADASGNTVPFVWTAGAGMEAITDQGTAIYGQAMAINDAGFVTGTADGKAFVLNSGNMELTWLTPATGQSAVDINNAGQIIGQFNFGPILGVPGNSAWIATEDDAWTHLTTLIPGNVESGEWSINDVLDINDDGWILANAYNYNDERSYQVLLRPVPEPGAAALLAFGSLGFLRRRRASISSPSTA